MSVLSLEDITGVLADTRSKTGAGEYLQEFINSGDIGREIDLGTGSFMGKDAKTVKTALDNARKRVTEEGKLVFPGAQHVQVRVKYDTNGEKGDKKVVTGEHLYIINTQKVAEAQAKAAKA